MYNLETNVHITISKMLLIIPKWIYKRPFYPLQGWSIRGFFLSKASSNTVNTGQLRSVNWGQLRYVSWSVCWSIHWLVHATYDIGGIRFSLSDCNGWKSLTKRLPLFWSQFGAFRVSWHDPHWNFFVQVFLYQCTTDSANKNIIFVKIKIRKWDKPPIVALLKVAEKNTKVVIFNHLKKN